MDFNHRRGWPRRWNRLEDSFDLTEKWRAGNFLWSHDQELAIKVAMACCEGDKPWLLQLEH